MKRPKPKSIQKQIDEIVIASMAIKMFVSMLNGLELLSKLRTITRRIKITPFTRVKIRNRWHRT